MDLTTKFEFGQTVWHIHQGREKGWEPCGFCDSVGYVKGSDGTTKSCPECYGRQGKHTYHELQWQISERSPLTIGQIRLKVTGGTKGVEGSEMFDNYKAQEASREEECMCVETGIGSGSVYNAEDLFPIEEAAQQECDARNQKEQDNAD